MFSYLQLDTFKPLAAEKVTYLIDAVSQEIPEDAVFAHYADTKQVRLMSRETLAHLHNRVKKAREIFLRISKDPSGIEVALAEDISNGSQYKKILQDMVNKGFNGETILWYCEYLQSVKYAFKCCPNAQIRNYLLALSLPILGQNGEILLKYINAAEEEKTLNVLFKEYFLKQTILQKESQGQLVSNGIKLSEDQIICPYTRKLINVTQSNLSSEQAKNFLALFVFISVVILKINDSALTDFIKNQSKGYMELGHQTLQLYTRQPQLFHFTPLQQQFLNDVGLQEIVRQTKQYENQRTEEAAYRQKLGNSYHHLWDNSKSHHDNILLVLMDYSKTNSFCPNLSLFFTGHWNRHHHDLIAQAVKNIEQGIDYHEVLQQLAEKAHARPDFNPEGSLARRLQFIKDHISPPAREESFSFSQ